METEASENAMNPQQQPLLAQQQTKKPRRARTTTARKKGAAASSRPGLDRSRSSRRMVKSQQKPVLNKLFKKSTVGVPQQHHDHSYVYTALNPRSKQPPAVAYKWFIMTVIIIDLVFFVVSTDPNLPKSSERIFKVEEGISSTIFLIEYIARVATCTESHKYAKYGPIFGRVRYMLTPAAVIDALATFPFFLEQITGWNLPQLTYLRVFRLLRITKTQGYAKAMDAVWRVIYYNREILYVALLVCVFLVIITAVLLYYLRPPNDSHEDFNSLAATMYLSTLMLTGQGGPEGPLPWYTRMVVLLTAVFSVAMFAIPASMLTWGFEAEAARLAARARRRKKSGIRYPSSSSSSSDTDSSSISTSDEEYQKIIAGEEDETDEDEKIKELMERFEKADQDESGGLSVSEFIRLSMEQQASGGSGIMNRHTHFGAAAAAVTAEDSSLTDRIEELEAKVDATNEKLDAILKLLKSKNV